MLQFVNDPVLFALRRGLYHYLLKMNDRTVLRYISIIYMNPKQPTHDS